MPVFFTVEKGQETRNFVVTTFVLEVLDRWFLITAGHCIRAIESLTGRCGYNIIRCQLIDSLGLGATHQEPIPFAYKEAHPACLSDDYAFDYGVMVLSPYYRRLLEVNKVQALNELVWRNEPVKVDFYILLGIPMESVKVDASSIEIAPTLLTVEPISEKPKGFAEVDAPLFYGRIVLGERLRSIEGMSGGPLFAFHKNESGELRYWLTALQSRWLPKSQFIAACPTTLLGHFLEGLVARTGKESS